MRRLRNAVRVSSWLLALALSACGGGGGGGDAAPAAPNVTGLIPAAPTLGPTLVSDATTLRPLIPNAVWSYRGLQTTGGLAAFSYNATLTHQAAGQAAVQESGQGQFNAGLVEQTVSHRNGEVRTASLFDLGTGQPQMLDQLELRSPVRVNDQYTVLELGGLNPGDLDGDGKNDTVDVAAYTRVIGEEILDLANAPQTRTVHTRMTMVSRARGTANGQTVTLEFYLDFWYAVGVGLVQLRSDVPVDAANTRQVNTDTLVNWDGVDQGIGHLEPVHAITPGNVGLYQSLGAVGFDTHALMLSFATTSPLDGFAVSRVSPRGQVLSTTTVPNVNPTTAAQIVRMGDTAHVLNLDSAGIQMHTFDSEGNLTAGPVVLKPGTVQSTGTFEQFVVASTDSAIWLGWIEGPLPPFGSPTLRVQPFDALGAPLDEPKILQTVSTATLVENLRMAGSSGHAVVSFAVGPAVQYALMKGSTLPANVHFLTDAEQVGAVRGAATTSGADLLWLTRPSGGALRLAGVRFDGVTEEPLRSTIGAVASELLSTPWLTDTNYLVTAASRSTHQDVYLMDVNGPSVLFELTPGTGPLATDNSARLLVKATLPMAPHTLVSLPNNVLAIANEPSGFATVTSVWRRP